MKKKSKNSFYNNKNRNQKWTETPEGRIIEFADKYEQGDHSGNKYTKADFDYSQRARKKEKVQRRKRNILIAFLSVVLICTGYTAMDVHIIRCAVPAHNIQEAVRDKDEANMSQLTLSITSKKTESVSLDNSVMLSSVIEEAVANGYSSIAFDAKRDDGTIGYYSTLASVDTYNAISSPSSKLAQSVKQLISNDILPIARICCYKDNIVPIQSPSAAVKNGSKPYTDKNGGTYLNPDSEITYSYIKDIVQECYGYGISVFALYGCDLPEEISEGYDDGFDKLSKRLLDDLGDSIKLIEEVDVEIKGRDSETGKTTNTAIRKDIKAFEKINKDKIYFISTEINDKRVVSQLEESKISSYIINKE